MTTLAAERAHRVSFSLANQVPAADRDDNCWSASPTCSAFPRDHMQKPISDLVFLRETCIFGGSEAIVPKINKISLDREEVGTFVSRQK